MTYDQQILHILTTAGERGISVQAIAKHVYNMNRTFFVEPDLEEIHNYVQQYLLKNSKSSQSLIESTGRRGYYRLNTTGCADASVPRRTTGKRRGEAPARPLLRFV